MIKILISRLCLVLCLAWLAACSSPPPETTVSSASDDLPEEAEEITDARRQLLAIIDGLDQDTEPPPDPIPVPEEPEPPRAEAPEPPPPEEPSRSLAEEPSRPLAEEPDRSFSENPLATAFGRLQSDRGGNPAEIRLDNPRKPQAVPPKADDSFRIALILPYDGRAKTAARHIREGAELALFRRGGKNIDMIFLDSNDPERAALTAAKGGADLILGPILGEKAKRVGARSEIPVLTFSNDTTAAGGNVLLLRQTPEQEIETVLNQALIRQRPNPYSDRQRLAIAIISQDQPYGQRIGNHARAFLNNAGIPPVANITLDVATLASEEALRSEIRALTGWIPPPDKDEANPEEESNPEEAITPPKFDIVILAGDQAFSLRVAPVLAWHDLDSDKVRYLGTSLWASPAILQEPSLRGGWFAAPPAAREIEFDGLWEETGKPAANLYTIIGYDAVDLATRLAPHNRRRRVSVLTQEAGFSGFSGVFRLLPNGRNIRLLDVREITSGGSKVVNTAPERF